MRWNGVGVWTGAEMLVWGGYSNEFGALSDGGRLDPATETWTPMSTLWGVPYGEGLNAFWTGSELLVCDSNNNIGRYNPFADAWLIRRHDEATPPGAESQSGVWTGTEMIVWGGGRFGSYHNTGGRYNPTANTWAATGTGSGVPSARAGQAAIWDGKEMIIWGGHDDTNLFVTGGRYDPRTESWQSTSTLNPVPQGRLTTSAVWTGQEMIVWGGAVSRLDVINTGARYNPSNNTWATMSNTTQTPSPRYTYSMVWTGTEVIVWGGGTPGVAATYFNTGGRYNPTNDSWRSTSAV